MALTLHEKSSQPDIVHDDIAGAEKRLGDLKWRFGKVSSRWDRGLKLRQFFLRLTLMSVVAICSFSFFWYLAESPWPVGLTLKHLAASPSCTAARMVGLAPARKGQPGYWGHLDADRDGIACEDFTPSFRGR
jgi:Excalibur calcium-binding domain